MKYLYHTVTGALHDYPRADDEPVENLDPVFLTLDLVQQPVPNHDPSTQVPEPTEVIDVVALTVTRGWVVSDRVATQAEVLSAKRAAMADAFDALPIAVQATFWETRVAAEEAMDRGKFDVARALVEAKAVPPELEPVKAVILAHFPRVVF